MYGILFRVVALPNYREKLIDFLKWDGQVARDEEEGTLRFEFYQDPKNANTFYVYEAYKNKAAFKAHTKSPPYKRWKSEFENKKYLVIEELFKGEAIWSP